MCFSNGVKGLKEEDEATKDPFLKPTEEFKNKLKREFMDFEPNFIESFYNKNEKSEYDRMVMDAAANAMRQGRN